MTAPCHLAQHESTPQQHWEQTATTESDLRDTQPLAPLLIIHCHVQPGAEHVLVVLRIYTRQHQSTVLGLCLSRAQHVGRQLASELDLVLDGAVLVKVPACANQTLFVFGRGHADDTSQAPRCHPGRSTCKLFNGVSQITNLKLCLNMHKCMDRASWNVTQMACAKGVMAPPAAACGSRSRYVCQATSPEESHACANDL